MQNNIKKIPIGALGESILCSLLRSKEHKIVSRNYRKPWGEIDIVSQKGSEIHFWEVKAVSREPGFSSGPETTIGPEENLHIEKMKRVARAAQSYLLENKIHPESEWQIDAALIYIDLKNKKAKVELLPSIGF